MCESEIEQLVHIDNFKFSYLRVSSWVFHLKLPLTLKIVRMWHTNNINIVFEIGYLYLSI